MSIRELSQDLRELIGDKGRLLDDLSSRQLYARDLAEPPAFFRRFYFDTVPDLVVQPRHTEDLCAIARKTQSAKLPVTPRGLGSWGYGGAIPTRAGVVIDHARMKRIEPPEGYSIWVEAGTRWGELDLYLAERGLYFPVFPTNRYATVGGWIATGGYGLNGLKYGHVSAHVSMLRVVLPDGTLREIGTDDPEFNLWFGSEGQLGSIAQAQLKLVTRPTTDQPVLLYYESRDKALRHLLRLQDSKHPPANARFLDREHMRALRAGREHRGQIGPEFPESQDALLLHFDERLASEDFLKEFGGPGGRFESGDARRAPDWVASAVWGERFHPMRAYQTGPGLLASEHLFEPEDYEGFCKSAGRLAARLGREIHLEATLVRSGDSIQILSIVTWITHRQEGLAGAINYLFVVLLTRLGLNKGGKVYGMGIWNGPFFRQRFRGKKVQKILALKRRIDPGGRQNPGKFPRVRSRRGRALGLLFRPAVFRGLCDIGLLFSPLLGAVSRSFGKDKTKITSLESHLARAVADCCSCGNCVTVCPAYTVTGHEQTTGRGKLQLAGRMLAGEEIEAQASDLSFLCTQCGACTDVCQTNIPLVEIYGELEQRLLALHGRPEEKIRAFVEELGGDDAYLRLIGSEPYGERHVLR
jgi:FAD/FMN-containing dehydrogenase/ferredoxin